MGHIRPSKIFQPSNPWTIPIQTILRPKAFAGTLRTHQQAQATRQAKTGSIL
jgi:hypothetical protein